MSDFLDSFRWLWNGSQSFDHAIEFASFPVDQEAFSHTNCWEIYRESKRSDENYDIYTMTCI